MKYLLILIILPAVFACRCMPPGTPIESLDISTEVFSGRVIDIDRLNVRSGAVTEVTFRVDTVWKGIITSSYAIKSMEGSSVCGFIFEKGKKYIVYAYSNTTNSCSRTRLLSDAAEDIEELGPGKEPLEPESNLMLTAVFIVAMLFIISTLALLFWKKKK